MIATLVIRLAQIILGLGILMQVILRDRIEPLVLVFYMLPLPVLAVVALFVAVFQHRFKRGSPRVGWIVCLALLSVWFARSWCWGPAAKPPALPQTDELRVLVWNISRPTAPSAALIDLVRELNPHFVVVIEPGKQAGDHLASYEAALPGYKADWMPRGIVWLSRLPSRYRHRGKLDEIGAYAYFEVEWLGQKLPVVAVDVYAQPFQSRGPQIKESLAHTQADPKALLLGDFNTPAESVHFLPVRARMRSTFETAGVGFRETWCWGLPVLCLDYFWVGRDWEVTECRKIHAAASDHAALFARIRLRNGA